MESIIKSCGCKHDAQDKEHGIHMRVHNPDKEGKAFRCTVCGHGREPRGLVQGRKMSHKRATEFSKENKAKYPHLVP